MANETNKEAGDSAEPLIKIYTLGRFNMERVDGTSPIPLHVRPKPLELLKVMISLGGQGIHSDLVSESLWPDADGDKAARSFSINLKRLRDDIGSDVGHLAVHLQGGRLSLESSLVWCDAASFSEAADYAVRNLEHPENGEEAWARLEEALELYRGPFLEGEVSSPEVMTARERLHQKFISLVEFAGAFCKENGQISKSIALYQKGLEVDDVNEGFYRPLIRCLMEQGRTAEALAAYQRCRGVLQASYDMEPSQETEALHQALLAQAARGSSAVIPLRDPSPFPAPVDPEREGHAEKNGGSVSAPAPAPSGRAEEGKDPAAGIRPALHGFISRKTVRLGGLALVLLLLLWSGWSGYRVWVLDPRAMERLKAEAAYPLPDEPSIAVLPFNNRGEKAGETLFADTFTENVIAQLIKVPGLFIISSESALPYKEREVTVQQVGRELGVAHVLNGTVQKSEDRVRITVTLSRTATGESVWAEVYDRLLVNTLHLQDEITRKIVTSLNVMLLEGEQSQIWERGAHDYRAWEYGYQGLVLLRGIDRDDNRRAQVLFKKALAIDPSYAMGMVGLGYTYFMDVRFGFTTNPGERITQAIGLARKAIELDDTLGEPYSLLGSIQLLTQNFDEAIHYGRLAVERQPNGAEVNALLAQTLNFAGQPGEALVTVKRAMRLSPTHPTWFDFQLGLAYYLLQRYPEALPVLNGYLKRMQGSTESPILLISIHLSQGNRKEARRLAKVLRNSQPSISIPVHIRKLMPFRDEAIRKRLLREMASMGFKAAP